MSLTDLLIVKRECDRAKRECYGGLGSANQELAKGAIAANLFSLTETTIRGIEARYGEEGLFRLFFLVSANGERVCEHFLQMIESEFGSATRSSESFIFGS